MKPKHILGFIKNGFYPIRSLETKLIAFDCLCSYRVVIQLPYLS